MISTARTTNQTDRAAFRMVDVITAIAYIAILLWFSQAVISALHPAFQNLELTEQATEAILVMIGIGSVSTLPLIWFYFSLVSKHRNMIVMPIATIAFINYGTLAVGNPIAAMGIATTIAATVLLLAKRFQRLPRFRWVLIMQASCYLVAGFIGRS